MVFVKQQDGVEVVSYNTVLARALIGEEVGETVDITMSGKKKSFRILSIE